MLGQHDDSLRREASISAVERFLSGSINWLKVELHRGELGNVVLVLSPSCCSVSSTKRASVVHSLSALTCV